MRGPLDSARAVVAAARRLYAFDPTAIAELDELDRRLDGPLRIALVGSVKAGKSTLLNGLLGERIAPTDARECTRIVTRYHYGATPSVRGLLTDGTPALLPAQRQPGRLELALQGLSPDEFERLDVSWPAPGIQGVTFIDTPGTISVTEDVSSQTDRFLLPEHGATGADAVVYLLRSLHDSDVRYLQTLHDRTRHGNAAIGAIAVLSRADELGAGRLTAMVSVNEAVERLRDHPALHGVCETIVPVAGLLGTGAMTLRQSDFSVFRSLATRHPDETRQLMISAERFLATPDDELPSERVRADLVDRFGMYGIRLALAAVRGGVDDAGELAEELLRRSGLEELRRVIDVHFVQRQSELKAHSIVLAVHRFVRSRPVPGSDEIVVMADEHMAGAHTFAETRLLGRIAARRLHLSADLADELERLVGGHGGSPECRLGVDGEELSAQELIDLAIHHLQRWRELTVNPLVDHETYRAAKTAERSCETIIVTLMGREHRASVTFG
ncbi:dynamin family protein [Aeromicrobium sp. YIM 150415]|uniref:dynamin family protein n=1 Tax=Aeromicrobium sp. YIM 150415 TaxID=2803912 RepID=UPI00196272EA|nr:dynamin family protein [Aeromicrobium sp. YIM 150415]MBM9462533.1 dynamin family protein [Aeromicrobium sp. YIM 150415]